MGLDVTVRRHGNGREKPGRKLRPANTKNLTALDRFENQLKVNQDRVLSGELLNRNQFFQETLGLINQTMSGNEAERQKDLIKAAVKLLTVPTTATKFEVLITTKQRELLTRALLRRQELDMVAELAEPNIVNMFKS